MPQVQITERQQYWRDHDEDLARLCETGTGDLVVRQSWKSIGVSNNVQIAF